jgi:hypothetical protein
MSFGIPVRNGLSIGLLASTFLTSGSGRLVPRLTLNFLTGAPLDSRITFTRSTTATFVGSDGLIQTAAINAPRFDYNPVTLAPNGLLIEEQRVNVTLYSQQLDDPTWSKTNMTITANAVTSPDGTVNADAFVEDTATSTHLIAQAVTIADSTTFTVSCYVKAAGRSWIAVAAVDKAGTANRIWFNVSTGAQGTTNGTVLGFSAVNAGNGWYRIVVSASSATGGSGASIRINAGSADNTPSYTGNGTASFYLYGAQSEVGSFATSYIPTVASTVTRTVDVASMTGTNFSSWYNQSEGTIVAQFVATTTGVGSTGGNDFPFVYDIDSAAAPTSGNSLLVSAGYGPGWRAETRVLGVTQAGLQGSMTLGNASVRKIAYAYQTNNFAASANGGTVSTDTSGTLPSPDRIGIGCQNANGGNSFTGYMQSITYYPSRLSDAQLQALTA